MGAKYKQLDMEERIEIARRRSSGETLRQIATALDRTASSIAREVKRNSAQTGRYHPIYADQQARARRWSGSKLSRDIVLLPFVRFNAFAHLSWSNWAFIAATGLIHTGVVFYLFFNSIKQLPTHITALLIFLDPAVAILLDVVITGFHPSLLQNLRIALIFLAMSMSLFKKQPKALPKRNNKADGV